MVQGGGGGGEERGGCNKPKLTYPLHFRSINCESGCKCTCRMCPVIKPGDLLKKGGKGQ